VVALVKKHDQESKTMKTTFIASLAAATVLSGAAYAANAPATMSDGFFFKPTVGLDYQFSSVSYKDISGTAFNYGDFLADSFNGGDVHIGARVHKYLGFEAGYFDNASSSKSNLLGTTASSSAKFNGWTLDAMGYLPLGESQKFELIGTVGVARISADDSTTVSGTTYSESGHETKGRIGAGAQYWLTDNLNIRGILRYQDADFSGAIKDVVIASLGVNWQF